MAGKIFPDVAIQRKRYSILCLMGLLQPARLRRVAYASRNDNTVL